MEIIPFFLARSSDEAIHAHSVINSLMQRDQGLSSPEKAPKIEKSFGCNPSPAQLTSLSDNAL
jgi:hypothetical protein